MPADRANWVYAIREPGMPVPVSVILWCPACQHLTTTQEQPSPSATCARCGTQWEDVAPP